MADLRPLDNLRAAYHRLEDTVIGALRTLHGDAGRLGEVRSQVVTLRAAADVHRQAFPPDEFDVLTMSLADMISALDSAAASAASSSTSSAAPPVVCERVKSGKRGRPRVEIDPTFLEFAMDLRGPTSLGKVFKCSSRTVRRRALELEIVPPGAPVRTPVVLPDGSTTVHYTSSSRPVSTMTDAELDAAVAAALAAFPAFGRKMLHGHFKSQGHNVPKARIKESYIRVCGLPRSFGTRRRIVRRSYYVPGPLSLVHHDGQHGLIHWKLVIHCFVDGYSRYVLGIRVHNNNRAATVLSLFLDTIAKHGTPSRVRGDHGTENLGVARWMEENRGVDRGSYIWGRSVHNTRIERLWYDVTTGFGQKWKKLFMTLEHHHGLDATNPSHIWLLHHLFLTAINRDAEEWASAWNAHLLSLPGGGSRSPRDMFIFGLLEHGAQGIEEFLRAEPPVEDLAEYGVDWEALNDRGLMAHFREHNGTDQASNPFMPASAPQQLSEVICDEPGCPFSAEQVQTLDRHLAMLFDMSSRDMSFCERLWDAALQLCLSGLPP